MVKILFYEFGRVWLALTGGHTSRSTLACGPVIARRRVSASPGPTGSPSPCTPAESIHPKTQRERRMEWVNEQMRKIVFMMNRSQSKERRKWKKERKEDSDRANNGWVVTFVSEDRNMVTRHRPLFSFIQSINRQSAGRPTNKTRK